MSCCHHNPLDWKNGPCCFVWEAIWQVTFAVSRLTQSTRDVVAIAADSRTKKKARYGMVVWFCNKESWLLWKCLVYLDLKHVRNRMLSKVLDT